MKSFLPQCLKIFFYVIFQKLYCFAFHVQIYTLPGIGFVYNGGVAVRFYFLLYRYLVPYPRLLERLSSFHCIAIFVINQVTIYMDLFLDSVPLVYLSIFTPNLHCLIIIALQIILKPGSVYFVVIPQDCFILFFPILTLFISFSRLLHWLKFLVQQKW